MKDQAECLEAGMKVKRMNLKRCILQKSLWLMAALLLVAGRGAAGIVLAQSAARAVIRPFIAAVPGSYGQPPPTDTRLKCILDTDIGDDIDDAYALALLGTRRDVTLLGVTTTYGQTRERAELAAKLLKVMGRGEVPVCAGRRGKAVIGRQYEWARGFRSASLKNEPAAEFMKREIDRAPGQVTLIGIGALTNIGDLLTTYPAVRGKIKQIVIMGGAVYTGYNNQAPAVVEWNLRCDPAAAKAVYSSGVPLVMAGLEVTTMMQLDPERQKRICAYGTPLTDALAALTRLWGNSVPTLFDPVAVAYALGHGYCDGEQRHVEVDDNGMTHLGEGTPNVIVLVHPQRDAFLDWYVSALTPSEAHTKAP